MKIVWLIVGALTFGQFIIDAQESPENPLDNAPWGWGSGVKHLLLERPIYRPDLDKATKIRRIPEANRIQQRRSPLLFRKLFIRNSNADLQDESEIIQLPPLPQLRRPKDIPKIPGPPLIMPNDADPDQYIETNKQEPVSKNQKTSFYYSVRSKTNGKALAVSSGGTADGDNVMLWDALFVDSQIWELRPVDEVYFQFVAKHSGKLLTVRDASLEEDANVEQDSEQSGNKSQQWKLESDAGGYVRIIAKHSKKCLSYRRRGELNKINIEQKSRLDSDDQKWLLSVSQVENAKIK